MAPKGGAGGGKGGKSSGGDDPVLAAFAELQEKLSMQMGFAQMVSGQLQRTRITQRRSELTLQELSSLPANVPVYKNVGKAYFQAPLPSVLDDLRDTIKAGEDEAQRLVQQQQHATKAAEAAEGEIGELIKANPALMRRLAAA